MAWCIGITNVDPIRHGLLFERFINPERLDLPDADLDFSRARRHEVIEYLNARYGEEYVAGIPNFTYLGAASALRDTARIYGVDAADMAVSKELKTPEDDSLSLSELREQLASLDKYATKHPDAFKAASKLQNLMRGFGRHAAGMIVAGVPLTERTPVERRGDARCIAFDKRYCEAMGLIKLDVLGPPLSICWIAQNVTSKRAPVRTSTSMPSHWMIAKYLMDSPRGIRKVCSSLSPAP